MLDILSQNSLNGKDFECFALFFFVWEPELHGIVAR